VRRILINHPVDGEWIMETVGGAFVRGRDHSIANHDQTGLLGGFVLNNYTGNAIFVHDAGRVKTWFSRDLAWMLFDYAFHQLGVAKVIGPVAADNFHALNVNLRGGFRIETVIADAMAPGVDMLLLTMVEADCRWLRHRPMNYCSGNCYKVA
jgi:hypothetical protein